jgi:hypothetical protein
MRYDVDMLGFEGFFTSGEKIRRNEEDLLKRFDEAPEAVRTDGRTT